MKKMLLVLVVSMVSSLSFAASSKGAVRAYDYNNNQGVVIVITGPAAVKLYNKMKNVKAVDMGGGDGYISSKQKVGENVVCTSIVGEANSPAVHCEITIENGQGVVNRAAAG